MNKFISVTNIVFLFLVSGCTSVPKNQKEEIKDSPDSIQITNLVRDIYKWYIANEDQIYFDVITIDSFQIGIDTIKLENSLTTLRNSNYFSPDFISNYRKIGLTADSILKSGKYYNEINFNFQDADIWLHSQGYENDYWKLIKFTALKINGDKASLRWYDESEDYSFLVRLRKGKGFWRVSYLEGLDIKEAL